ncbi:MAG: IS1/IS1595 family N-terminal zinc-binding domain-containing protein [Candidatus Thorarchaeota archaeon]
MKAKRLRSPWAHQASDIECPRCHSHHVYRIFDRWGRSKGVQMFQCTSCGRKYYTRGIDNFRPTFGSRYYRRR